jgi:histidyl-tRNA synthetase
MAGIAIAPKGTKDVLPDEAYKWIHIENKIRELTGYYGFNEVRTPVFEHTEIFERGVGNETDIVQKEMYTFNDKAGRSITLKPEGTAGVVRAYIEKGMHSWAQPVKMYYLTPVFRYEAPQSGRLREHHQFGVEVFGSKKASVDAEVICLASALFRELGISGLKLYINSIGCEKCRPAYHDALKKYIKTHFNELCDICKGRFERNPLRILDCKEADCGGIANGAPKVIDFGCEECQAHFSELQNYLKAQDVEFSINPRIVRGLDYYTKTVFEFISTDIGAQSTVCGGGRYDNLVAACGGPAAAGVGFGMGLERLLMVIDSQKIDIPKPTGCFTYIAILNEGLRSQLFRLMNDLRAKSIPADMDHMGRGLKAQFKYADKIGAVLVCIMGDDELAKEQMKIRNMSDGEEIYVPVADVVEFIEKKYKSFTGGII